MLAMVIALECSSGPEVRSLHISLLASVGRETEALRLEMGGSQSTSPAPGGPAPASESPEQEAGSKEETEDEMAAQRLGKRVLSKLQSPSRARSPGGSPSGLQKRHARVTVKYDRRELQRRLDVEKWIDGCLEELYRGRESDMPDEVNIDELLELSSEEERSRKIRGLLEACANPTEDFVQELLAKLRGLHKQPGFLQPSPSDDRSLSPRQDRAHTAPP
ncbi:protein phosphatase 1 regulatory subunit 14A [Apodemus sylvaticus]|uniref:protein phosphatase 1 regulatory subunit 14A n=1 Tax=Apodemus sylvaticus TaxID=10129 RepID=UPI002241A930|nr:protein phosphatase 1 regulatory subunit 14A [Apodemus sylvaticus]